MALTDLNLSRNPFKDMTPSRRSSTLIWAGMTTLKRKIVRSYEDFLADGSKQMILNWGPYGGGKTFSAYYFIKEYEPEPSLKHIYLRSPKDGNKITKEFFKGIIDDLRFDVIHEHVRSLIEVHGENELFQLLIPKATSEYAKAICLIGNDNPQIKDLMNRFIYSGLTKTELKGLGLAKDIQSDSDAVKFLSGLLACFAGEPSIYDGKLVLWLDEMEDIIYYAAKNYKAFSQVLRDLYDSFSGNIMIFLNFTLAEGEESTIETILGGAIWSRITKKIRYTEITSDDALLYINDLLASAKINPDNDAPFDPTSSSEIIRMIAANNLTPREINRYFSSIINFALRRDRTAIDTTLLNEWFTEFEEDI